MDNSNPKTVEEVPAEERALFADIQLRLSKAYEERRFADVFDILKQAFHSGNMLMPNQDELTYYLGTQSAIDGSWIPAKDVPNS